MEMRQKTELRRLLIPELRQSLKILTLPLLDLKTAIQEELTNNPLLEETPPKNTPTTEARLSSSSAPGTNSDLTLSLAARKPSLQDILLRQLGMFSDTDEELHIGQEIIGNIDDNGYLKTTTEDIAATLKAPLEKVESVHKLILHFDPPGVAARNLAECLLTQLELANETDPLLKKLIQDYLDDIAKKNYSHIAKSLKEPLEKIEFLIKQILRLDPKPGRNYSSENIQHIVPDIIIDDKGEEFDISINNEDIPTLNVNKDYRKMLKANNLDPQTKEFLTQKLHNALELLRSIYKRQRTLRKVVDIVVETQPEAMRSGLSHLVPMTFREIAERLSMHESTISRTVMNKYMQLPWGVVALKDFFTSSIQDKNGDSISSSHIKGLIKELIEKEDKKHSLSDADIAKILTGEKNLNISRRTVAKYREELRILSSTFRRER